MDDQSQGKQSLIGDAAADAGKQVAKTAATAAVVGAAGSVAAGAAAGAASDRAKEQAQARATGGPIYAPPRKRLFAYMIDVVIIGAISVAIAWVLGLILGEGTKGYEDWLPRVGGASAIVGLVYFTLQLAKDGQTIGKKSRKIQVVNKEDQGDITFVQALLRTLLLPIDVGVFFIGCFLILFTDHHQRFGDMLGKTIVIKERPPAPTGPAAMRGQGGAAGVAGPGGKQLPNGTQVPGQAGMGGAAGRNPQATKAKARAKGKKF